MQIKVRRKKFSLVRCSIAKKVLHSFLNETENISSYTIDREKYITFYTKSMIEQGQRRVSLVRDSSYQLSPNLEVGQYNIIKHGSRYKLEPIQT
jgi:stage III sporulation protein SpoIIIAA